MPSFDKMKRALATMFFVVIFILIEWKGREGQYALENMKNIRSKPIRLLSYLIILLVICFFGNFDENLEFIYFQF